MREIPLGGKCGQGRTALVSDDDYEHLSQRSWCVSKNQNGYEQVLRGERWNGKCRIIYMGKAVLERKLGRKLLAGEEADHKNRNTLDNRSENLRVATRSDNGANKGLRRDNTTGYMGVSSQKSTRKWRARIARNQQRVHLGYFVTPEEAAQAYDRAARELHGEFAVLNFPSGETKCMSVTGTSSFEMVSAIKD